MRIAIIGDAHVEDTEFSKQRFTALISHILANKVDDEPYSFVWFIGDLSHKSSISVDLLIFFKEQFQRLIDAKIIPQYIEGNHERRNATDYLLTSQISQLTPITKIPRHFKINNTAISAYGHNELKQLVTDNDKAHILLSHFRWTTSLYKSELPTKTLKELTSRYNILILGDIHEEYEPEPNVIYTNAPYNISYGRITKRGYISLTVSNTSYTVTREHVVLPNKILVQCNFDDLEDTIDRVSADTSNMYKIRVKLHSQGELVELQQYPMFGDNYFIENLLTPKSDTLNVEVTQTYTKVDVSEVFLDSLPSTIKDTVVDALTT